MASKLPSLLKHDPAEFVSLEEALRRVSARIGACRASLHVMGVAAALRKERRPLGWKTRSDGGIKPYKYAIPIVAIDTICRRIAEGKAPLPPDKRVTGGRR